MGDNDSASLALARGIRSRTLDGYEGSIHREIVPVIGGLELANRWHNKGF